MVGSALRSERPEGPTSRRPTLRPIVEKKTPSFSPEQVYEALSQIGSDWSDSVKESLGIEKKLFVHKARGMLSFSDHPSGLEEFSLNLRIGNTELPKSRFGISVSSGPTANHLVFMNMEKGYVIKLDFKTRVWETLKEAVRICNEAASKSNPVVFDNGLIYEMKPAKVFDERL